LILDLRGNPGGDNSFSDYMVAYFATRPFSFTSAFYVKTSQITKEYWKNVSDTDTLLADLKRSILEKKDGEQFEANIRKYAPRTDSLKFEGKVYVLIDRYSYSNTATTAAIVQDYKFGVLIGEQTADSPTLYGAVHEFELPNTKISITYPKALMVRPSGDRTLAGVKPDFSVPDDMFTTEDEVLNWTVAYINKK
jgi:C-terminal processing protease CtpA/Prc